MWRPGDKDLQKPAGLAPPLQRTSHKGVPTVESQSAWQKDSEVAPLTASDQQREKSKKGARDLHRFSFTAIPMT